MSRTYSSSSLKPFLKNCPKALDFYQSGTPVDRTDLDRGVCAHAILEYAAGRTFHSREEIEKLADDVTAELIAHGRAFRGEPQPPLVPESAFEGRDLAVEYLMMTDVPRGDAEVELWMDAKGGHDGEARYVALVDLVYRTEIGEEDDTLSAIVVRDYKTAWSTGPDETETLQMRGQAALAALHYPDAQVIVREAVNVRTGAVYRSETLRDEEGEAQLALWRENILRLCDAADANAGARMARPGYGCLSCWYADRCEDCLSAMQGDDLALAWVTAKARMESLQKALRKAAKDRDLKVPGGVAGYRKKASRRPSEYAADVIIEYSYGNTGWNEDRVKGLLMKLKPGVTQIENFAKASFERGDVRRDDFLDAALETQQVARFGVWNDKEENNEK